MPLTTWCCGKACNCVPSWTSSWNYGGKFETPPRKNGFGVNRFLAEEIESYSPEVFGRSRVTVRPPGVPSSLEGNGTEGPSPVSFPYRLIYGEDRWLNSPQSKTKRPSSRLLDASSQLVADALRGLDTGPVTFIVQDGLVIQIERTEKKRLVRPRRSI